MRPILEYNTVIWSPFNKCDIDSVEKVQRRLIRWLPGLRNLTYGQRLETALDSQLWNCGDYMPISLCATKLCLVGLTNLTFADFFTFNSVTATRGHRYKLYVNHCEGVRKHFFRGACCWPVEQSPCEC